MSETAIQQSMEEENQRLRRAVEELSVLNDLARTIGAEHDSEKIMHTVVRRSLQAIHAEQGVITLADDTAENTGHTLIRTRVSSTEHLAFHANQALLGWMYLHKTPLVINSLSTDDRFRGVEWCPEVRSILSVPLIVKSRLIGILTVYNKKEAAGFTPDDQRLLSIIASQSSQVIENSRLYEAEKALLQMEQDVRMAQKIQSDLLPKEAPTVESYAIIGQTIPARTVGGDYFDFIRLSEHLLGLCVGDVSGKGLPASLLMANLQATIRGQVHQRSSVAESLQRANVLLFHSTSAEKFATVFYGQLDVTAHTLTYCNAGHEPPLLVSADGTVLRLEAGGMMLGAFEGYPFAEETVPLSPGDVLAIVTDGITEAADPSGALFGTDRLLETIQAHRGDSVERISDALMQSVREYTQGLPQADDTTLLVVKRLK
jgi:phosphoserine phosphatase RsbU/P